MWKQLKHSWLLFINIVLGVSGFIMFLWSGKHVEGEAYLGSFGAVFCMAILLVLSISCVGEKAEEVSFWFRLLLLFDMIMAWTGIFGNTFDGYPNLIELNYVMEFLLFGSIAFQSYFYWFYIRREIGDVTSEERPRLRRGTLLMDTINGIAIILLIVNRFSGFLFWIDQAGVYHRGKYFPLSWVCPILLLICCGILIVMQKVRTSWKLVHLSYLILPLMIYPYQVFHAKMMPLNMGITLALLLMYCVNYMDRRKVLLEQKELLAVQQREMLELEIQLMISQIQPHFLYNTIAMIRGLCRENPEAAADSLGYFSSFLRGSLHMMQKKECISIEEELKLVESYMYLEQMRFGDRLEYIEDIEDVSFKIPALTIEPILENAVHHGIEEKEEGGMVLLEVTEDELYNIIRITDDGAGFDTSIPIDTKKHIGMTNVKERLWKMCRGTLKFESVIGEGTTAIIRIPKEKTEYKKEGIRVGNDENIDC
ncbi:MAG: histidine kinase [Lachnospiraceae bacterium]|nr:histidine kinase [Lachnospiraceae bacterium]